MSDDTIWDTVTGETEAKSPFALRVLKDNLLIRTIRLEPDVTYIGRMPENHVVLDDPKVSRSHARIFRKGEALVIEDQASENGMSINGKKVPSHKIAIGDRIAIGSHILEVIKATEKAQTVAREENLEDGKEESWRMDRTLSISSEQIQALHLARMKTKDVSSKAPVMSVSLKVGEHTYSKEIVFEKGKKRDPGQPNQLEVKVEVGSWILEKKVPL